MAKASYEIRVCGLVQGVGFRPFIFKLAKANNILGTVENNNEGVLIIAEGEELKIKDFINSIRSKAPVAAMISSIFLSERKVNGFKDFRIKKSRSYSDDITEVSPDIAVCDDCLRDMKEQHHRIDYPFINCTNCGPRFTIIRDLPYDRPKTTMAPFKMCPQCEKEYKNVLDRRFHAQPVACSTCGPHYTLHFDGKEITDLQKILNITSQLIGDGKILAIKGLGGYHLACDAQNEEAVRLLRQRKNREGKPFAVMFGDKEILKEYLFLDSEEEQLLTSWRRPIILLKIKKALVPSVSIGLDTVGAMLPYMPFHYLLFEHLTVPALVMTSGNLSDEPILIDNKRAIEDFSPITDAIITYNRDIHNRTDDSVCMIVNKKERVIRRSRSFVPSPVVLNLNTEGIFAAGAELVNCFAIGKGKQAILSQHIGDLKNLETLDFYSESVNRFSHLFRFKPEIAVADLHPDYLSSRYADETGLPLLQVQHHHAHIASCMAENRLDEKVIGISFDGTGLGTDGRIWGGEFLICDLLDFERAAHFEYIPMPGGDLVTKEPWRMAVACLFSYFGETLLRDNFKKYFPTIEEKSFETVLFMLKQNINCPQTSSAGRLFDAVSALIGVCPIASYHAEPPMRLESVADQNCYDIYPFGVENGVISFKQTFSKILDDLSKNTRVEIISSKFHNTIVQIIIEVVSEISEETRLKKVALSGGTFQNKILLENAEKQLRNAGYDVYSHSLVPSNDGGIALGQMAIAAKNRSTKNNQN
ncbi:MAG: carbamoyltransferase HypF [Bacteroidales bacterium]|nr:carbamoyltransferase HypF [Bacteroidales bacterium]